MKIQTKVEDYESDFRAMIEAAQGTDRSLLLYAASASEDHALFAAQLDSNGAANIIHELVQRFGPHVLIGALPVGSVMAVKKAGKDAPLFVPKSTETIQ